MNFRYRVFWTGCLLAAGVALAATAAAQGPRPMEPMPGPATNTGPAAGPFVNPGFSDLLPRQSQAGFNHCPYRAETCVQQWGPANGGEPDLAFFDRNVKGLRCDFAAYLSPESTLTAEDLEDLDRRLRRNTYERVHKLMIESPDFRSATLSCATLAHLDDVRWRAARRERLVDKAVDKQQERREQQSGGRN